MCYRLVVTPSTITTSIVGRFGEVVSREILTRRKEALSDHRTSRRRITASKGKTTGFGCVFIVSVARGPYSLADSSVAVPLDDTIAIERP